MNVRFRAGKFRFPYKQSIHPALDAFYFLGKQYSDFSANFRFFKINFILWIWNLRQFCNL